MKVMCLLQKVKGLHRMAATAAAAKSLQSCPLCGPTDGSPPGSPPPAKDSPQPKCELGRARLQRAQNPGTTNLTTEGI